MIWYDMTWHDMAWHDMTYDIWYDMIRYMIYDIISCMISYHMGTSCRGYELSLVRVVLGTSCPGHELSWVRVVLGTSCPDPLVSRVSNAQDNSYPRQLVHRSTCTQYQSYLRQLSQSTTTPNPNLIFHRLIHPVPIFRSQWELFLLASGSCLNIKSTSPAMIIPMFYTDDSRKVSVNGDNYQSAFSSLTYLHENHRHTHQFMKVINLFLSHH